MNDQNEKSNLCDAEGECTVTGNESQGKCLFYAAKVSPPTYCDHFAWYGGCLCWEAREDAKTRGSVVVTRLAHNQIHAGSTPAPATRIWRCWDILKPVHGRPAGPIQHRLQNKDSAIGGSGESVLNKFRLRCPAFFKVSWHHFLYRNRVVWSIRFFYNDIFNADVQPQNGLSRWKLFVSDFKFIWR